MNTGKFKLDPEELILENVEIKDKLHEILQEEQEFIEEKLKLAVLRDYDGVDINYKPATQSFNTDPFDYDLGVQSIEPWRGEPPKSDNGLRTERYSWKWFDNEELKRHIRKGDLEELKQKLS